MKKSFVRRYISFRSHQDTLYFPLWTWLYNVLSSSSLHHDHCACDECDVGFSVANSNCVVQDDSKSLRSCTLIATLFDCLYPYMQFGCYHGSEVEFCLGFYTPFLFSSFYVLLITIWLTIWIGDGEIVPKRKRKLLYGLCDSRTRSLFYLGLKKDYVEELRSCEIDRGFWTIDPVGI